jgi:protein phosphatase
MASDQGALRSRNEDVVEFEPSGEGVTFAVADGMGGHGDGQRAAALAADVTLDRLRASGDAPIAQALEAALDAANQALLDSQRSGGASDLGCTIVAGRIHRDRLWLGHLGDVRALRFRGGRVAALTVDHNPDNDSRRLNEAELPGAGGGISQAAAPPTRALGRRLMKPEVTEHALEADDVVVVCTDGVWRCVEAGEFASLVDETPGRAWAIARALVDRARNRGQSDDNASALVICCRDGSVEAVTSLPAAARFQRSAWFALAGLILGAGLALLLARVVGPHGGHAEPRTHAVTTSANVKTAPAKELPAGPPETSLDAPPTERSSAPPPALEAPAAPPVAAETRPPAPRQVTSPAAVAPVRSTQESLPATAVEVRLEVLPPSATKSAVVRIQGRDYAAGQRVRLESGQPVTIRVSGPGLASMTETAKVPGGARVLEVTVSPRTPGHPPPGIAFR